MHFPTFIVATALCLVSVVQCAYVPNKLPVYTPRIIQPNATTVWTGGQEELVIWNTTNPSPPTNISNGASVVLYTTFANGHKNITVLAKGFDLRSGTVKVTVPSNIPADEYSITLFGDSGNWSSDFKINAAAPPP